MFIAIHALNANSVDRDQMPHFAASDLGLNCLPMCHLWDAMYTWVKGNGYTFRVSNYQMSERTTKHIITRHTIRMTSSIKAQCKSAGNILIITQPTIYSSMK